MGVRGPGVSVFGLPPYQVLRVTALNDSPVDFAVYLTNGKRHSVHYRVMDARGRLLSTKEA